MNNLDFLISFITKHFPFDTETYPELKDATEEQIRAFSIKHLALHFAKTAGAIVSVSEDADHGDLLDLAAIQKQIPKALINTLRLAALVHMSGTDIQKAIEEKYKDTL